MTLAATGKGLAGVWFNGQQHMPATGIWPQQQDHPVLLRAQEQLQAYFAGQCQGFDVPLDLHGGTAFQQAVWQALLSIPAGATTSYGVLAERIGRPTAARAVGAAVGRNPVSIIVPCHRVVGAHGALTGYAGGLERKTALLQLEQKGQGLFADRRAATITA
jgi:methylated-DNA-[protein]-cysteine S-methyltransferase